MAERSTDQAGTTEEQPEGTAAEQPAAPAASTSPADDAGTEAADQPAPPVTPPGDAGTEAAGQPAEPSHGAGRAAGKGLRDMLLSMLALGVIVLILAALSHSCSFSPGGPSTNTASLPTVDVLADLRVDARYVKYPVRVPTVPAGWRPNSDSQGRAGGGKNTMVQVGWITSSGRYLQLSQSDATMDELAGAVAGTPVQSRGTTDVAGIRWTSYPGVRDEQSWVADLGTVRLLVTGNGDDADFRTLATATQTATPLPS